MKIKKVIIDGFRAYENAENGTFDFSMDSGDCADFVAIFAPNGFGKTSFYDAVEYALTENISRFVRDGHRIDYDSKSRTQVQRKRKQYILRNHSISDSTVARVQVTLDISGKEKLVEKSVPKPKAGSRDFHFKKRTVEDNFSGLADVFLSQESIDAFLREEKAEARYLRFMSNFGDSDEVYRSNLSILKRELESSLEETRAAISQMREIAERPISLDVFSNINQSIASLGTNDSAVRPIDGSFNAEQELSLRSEISKRLYELNLSDEHDVKDIAGLTHLVAACPTFVTALKQKETASHLIAEIEENRLEFKKFENARQSAKASKEKLGADRKEKAELANLSLHVPEFELAIRRRSQIVKSKATHLKTLNIAQVNLAALEHRESECKKRINEIDAAIQRLLDSQKSSTAAFAKIEVEEDRVKNHEVELGQTQKYIDALVITLQHNREQFEKVRTLSVTRDLLDSQDLTLIASLEFSPIELRAALVELNAKEVIAKDRAKLLESAKLQSGKLTQFVDLGRTLVNELKAPHCPLCSHNHGSLQKLLDAVLDNKNLSKHEDEALRQSQDAELSVEISSRRVMELVQQAENSKLKRVDELRQLINKNELELSVRRATRKEIENKLSVARQDIEDLKRTTLNLPLVLFSEKIASEITQKQLSKEAEFLDLARTKTELKEIQSRQKVLLQEVETGQAELDIIEGDERFARIVSFCQKHQIDFDLVRESIDTQYNEISARLHSLQEKIKNELTFISDLVAKQPYLANWNSDEALASKTRAQQDSLSADAVIVPFITRLKLHIHDFDEARLDENLAERITEALNLINKKRDTNASKLQNYSILERQLDDVRPFVESLQAQENIKALDLERQEKEALESILQSEYYNATTELNKKIKKFFYPDLINSIYRRIDPHPDFKKVEFACDFENERPTLEVFVADQDGDLISPNLYFSAAQVNILSLSIFLARALHAKEGESEIGCIFIDDPIHSMDSINVLSTIDLLRSLSLKFKRQIILSTHDKNFFELLQRKLPSEQCKAKFLELETFGKVVPSKTFTDGFVA
jgi:exonuclease SbcC